MNYRLSMNKPRNYYFCKTKNAVFGEAESSNYVDVK